jgi:hypothetical protein
VIATRSSARDQRVPCSRLTRVALRPKLVAVQAQDSEVRRVVASAVLALDDVVDTERVVLAPSMAAVRAVGMSGDHLGTELAP